MLSPVVLLLLLLVMERVERLVRDDAAGVQLARLLADAQPEELEAVVETGFAPTVDRYWRRRRTADRLSRRYDLFGARRADRSAHRDLAVPPNARMGGN